MHLKADCSPENGTEVGAECVRNGSQNGPKYGDEDWELQDFMYKGKRICLYKSPRLNQRALQLLQRVKSDCEELKLEYVDDVFEEWAKREDRHQDLFDFSVIHPWRFCEVDRVPFEWVCDFREICEGLIGKYKLQWTRMV